MMASVFNCVLLSVERSKSLSKDHREVEVPLSAGCSSPWLIMSVLRQRGDQRPMTSCSSSTSERKPVSWSPPPMVPASEESASSSPIRRRPTAVGVVSVRVPLPPLVRRLASTRVSIRGGRCDCASGGGAAVGMALAATWSACAGAAAAAVAAAVAAAAGLLLLLSSEPCDWVDEVRSSVRPEDFAPPPAEYSEVRLLLHMLLASELWAEPQSEPPPPVGTTMTRRLRPPCWALPLPPPLPRPRDGRA